MVSPYTKIKEHICINKEIWGTTWFRATSWSCIIGTIPLWAKRRTATLRIHYINMRYGKRIIPFRFPVPGPCPDRHEPERTWIMSQTKKEAKWQDEWEEWNCTGIIPSGFQVLKLHKLQISWLTLSAPPQLQKLLRSTPSSWAGKGGVQ